ncbi:hypothetical protein MA16_Dca017263 [Dendrobium catenatum]|uniref:CTLH domain-containing protein n=1 Tax=Dendrobium catenatum TaxID=906689 RepID=A0A2I0VU66_9ASPA|nr:hypothetical protein MA16_Dca017263 [Dendrobium catenatum]
MKAARWKFNDGRCLGRNLTVVDELTEVQLRSMVRKRSNSGRILDTNPQLYFHLQQQRLIELIRYGKVEEALEFAQEELAPRGEENRGYWSSMDLHGKLCMINGSNFDIEYFYNHCTSSVLIYICRYIIHLLLLDPMELSTFGIKIASKD